MDRFTGAQLIVWAGGITLLLFGRRLFWFFVAAIGFAAGYLLARDLWPGANPVLIVALSAILGLIGALLAVFLQKTAIGISGFLTGGYVTFHLLSLALAGSDTLPWAGFVIGGLFGAMLLSAAFDWALVFLSSIAGAMLIVRSIGLPGGAEAIAFALAAVGGILFQTRLLSADKPGSG